MVLVTAGCGADEPTGKPQTSGKVEAIHANKQPPRQGDDPDEVIPPHQSPAPGARLEVLESNPESSPSPNAEPAHPLDSLNPPKSPTPAPLPPIDKDRIAAQGIRKVTGTRLILYTDLPVDRAIEELPRLFEQAVPLWCDYFHIEQPKLAQWQVRGCLMKEKQRFIAAGLLPTELPEFTNGYTHNNEIWWSEQNTHYYRRHLMLHEGTHSFMYATFGTCGPPWYMEGLAELLGTHRLADGKLTLGWFPATRDDVPNWGRIKIIRDAVRSDSALTIDEILAYNSDAYLENGAYGWSWALAAFLDGHPRYRERFRSLPGKPSGDDFIRTLFADDWREMNIEWQVFIHEIDYGYDLPRNAIKFRLAEPLGRSAKTVGVVADSGWQSSGIRLNPGEEYAITAVGRYQVADRPKIWWSEPGGVTIRYHDGRPLGQLLAMVVPDEAADGPAWPTATTIGSTAKLTVTEPSTLYFKINDSPAELADNAGSLEVTIGQRRR
jgi:hypothetical protein